jgi:hypothetical protein
LSRDEEHIPLAGDNWLLNLASLLVLPASEYPFLQFKGKSEAITDTISHIVSKQTEITLFPGETE